MLDKQKIKLEDLGFVRWRTPHTYKTYYRKKIHNGYELVCIDMFNKTFKIINVANTTNALIKATKNKIEEIENERKII